MKRLTCLILSQVVLTASVNAASFDCGKASTEVEKLICRNPELSTLDEDLGNLYKSLKRGDAADRSLTQSQRIWIQERNGCFDIECFKKAYNIRLTQLRSFKASTGKIPLTNLAACKMAADYFNHDRSNELRLPPTATTTNLDSSDLKSIFASSDEVISNDSVRYWSVDLNSDGVLDHLAIAEQGTAHFNSAYVISGKKGAALKALVDPNEIGMDLDILYVGGRYFIEDGEGKLWRLSNDDKLEPVCRFKQAGKPTVTLVFGKNNPVCNKIDPDAIHYVAYSLNHSIDSLPDGELFWSKTPKPGVARVDIDNDGKLDNMVRLDFVHGAGRGCGVTYLAVTNSSRSDVPPTALNKLLLDDLGGFPCGPNQDAFVQDGVTYVDAFDGNHKIYRIKENKAEEICRFQTHSVVEAVEIKQQ